MINVSQLSANRAKYSKKRLGVLKSKLARLQELRDYPGITVFGVGSFARLEASKYSDIDLFFLTHGSGKDIQEARTKSLRLFGKVIDIAETLNFPKFSNDCQYLNILHTDDMLDSLGGPTDDHENYFTARMLLLLESHCLYGQKPFEDITRKIIRFYFKDFPDHKRTFQPMFLLNDICRYWKTMLLNYENKRKLPSGKRKNAEKVLKQKVRNFKLKYSRMTTCFATVAALGSLPAPVTEEQVVALTKLTPQARLQFVAPRIDGTQPIIQRVLDNYSWFLKMTGLSTPLLENHFSDRAKRKKMFENANNYGDSMYELLQKIDQSQPDLRLFRNLVI